jgi:hypothetical protein
MYETKRNATSSHFLDDAFLLPVTMLRGGMSYEVTKTIHGRQYRYRQWTYRGADGRVRTGNEYLGPVDGGRRRKRGISGVLDDLVRKRDKKVETEEEMRARVAREDAEYAQQVHINDLLAAPTISLDAINEIAGAQSAPATANAENDQVAESAEQTADVAESADGEAMADNTAGSGGEAGSGGDAGGGSP